MSEISSQSRTDWSAVKSSKAERHVSGLNSDRRRSSCTCVLLQVRNHRIMTLPGLDRQQDGGKKEAEAESRESVNQKRTGKNKAEKEREGKRSSFSVLVNQKDMEKRNEMNNRTTCRQKERKANHDHFCLSSSSSFASLASSL